MRGILCACLAVLVSGSTALGVDDWDIYMLRLANRARQDPAGEPARIGTSVTDADTTPRPPLAYDLLVGAAATNHNNWMHTNLGSVAREGWFGPDSLTHFETTNGEPDGPPAIGSPDYTGVAVEERLAAAGLDADAAGQNIAAVWWTDPLPINIVLLNNYHRMWWENATARGHMLNPDFRAFGIRCEGRGFNPPRGGLVAPIDFINFVTQNYARPTAAPQTYILAMIYADLDGNGTWTPQPAGSPQREGHIGLPWRVLHTGTDDEVMSGVSALPGALSINIGDGVYDIEVEVAGPVLGKLRIENVTVAGQNVDAGDYNTLGYAKADFNGDRHVDADDFAIFQACATRAGVPYDTLTLPAGCPGPYASSYIAPDFDQDQDVDLDDFAVFQRCYSGAAVAEKDCGSE